MNSSKYRSQKDFSTDVQRIAQAITDAKALKGLQCEVTDETLGIRMARKLPESANTLKKYLRDLDSKTRDEIGLPEKKSQAVKPKRKMGVGRPLMGMPWK